MPSTDRETGDGHEAAGAAGATQNAAKPLAISVSEFCRLSSLGRTSAFKLIRAGKLERRRVGGRTIILMRSVEALLGLNAKSPDDMP